MEINVLVQTHLRQVKSHKLENGTLTDPIGSESLGFAIMRHGRVMTRLLFIMDLGRLSPVMLQNGKHQVAARNRYQHNIQGQDDKSQTLQISLPNMTDSKQGKSLQ